MAVTTISGLSTYLVNTFSNLPDGISGTMYQTVDFQRMYVQGYTGVLIDENSISEVYQPCILNFALAHLVNIKISNGDGGTTTLGEQSMSDGGALMSAQQYKALADAQLKALPRAVSFARSLSA